MHVETTAVGAMRALCEQLEARLNRSEDYRALKELQRAITAVVGVLSPEARLAQALEKGPELILSTPQSTPLQRPIAIAADPPPATAPQTHSSLIQRLNGSFPTVSTVKATLAPSNAASPGHLN